MTRQLETENRKLSLNSEIHIWTADLDQLKMNFDDNKYTLPDSERKKAKRFHFEIHRTRYIKCHYLLRTLLGMYHGIDFYDQEFHINKHGKPALKKSHTKDSIYFNMSNSDNICVCAFRKQGEIGVDIEKIHDLPDMGQIVERFFSSAEKEIFRSLPGQSRKQTFFRYWTRKEALLKAMGVGLSMPLDKVDVMAGQEETLETFIRTTVPGKESEWTLHDINVFDNFASALAVKGKYIDCAQWLRCFHLTKQTDMRWTRAELSGGMTIDHTESLEESRVAANR